MAARYVNYIRIDLLSVLFKSVVVVVLLHLLIVLVLHLLALHLLIVFHLLLHSSSVGSASQEADLLS